MGKAVESLRFLADHRVAYEAGRRDTLVAVEQAVRAEDVASTTVIGAQRGPLLEARHHAFLSVLAVLTKLQEDDSHPDRQP